MKLYEIFKIASQSWHIYTFYDKKYDVECLVREKNNSLFISFNGSDSLTDWMNNIFDNIFYPQKTKHELINGFYNSYHNQISTQLKKYLAQNKTKEIIVTGFSRGASIAKICALDLLQNTNREISLYCFASSKVGNKEFENYIYENCNIYKVIYNGSDIVQYLPPWKTQAPMETITRIGKKKLFPSIVQHEWSRYKKELQKVGI